MGFLPCRRVQSGLGFIAGDVLVIRAAIVFQPLLAKLTLQVGIDIAHHGRDELCLAVVNAL
jgi:hypothetical protein